MFATGYFWICIRESTPRVVCILSYCAAGGSLNTQFYVLDHLLILLIINFSTDRLPSDIVAERSKAQR